MSEQSSDGTEHETVFVVGRSDGGGGARKAHTDPECHALKQARSVFERRQDVYANDLDYCQWCSGDVEQPETQDVSHYNALVAAAETDTEADRA